MMDDLISAVGEGFSNYLKKWKTFKTVRKVSDLIFIFFILFIIGAGIINNIRN